MDDPTPSDAWTAGFEAGRERRALASNPYPAGTDAFRTWQAGWREAEGTGRPGDEAPADRTP